MPEQTEPPFSAMPAGRQPPDAAAIARVNALADRADRTIAVATALLDQKRRVALAGLEDQVGALCAQILDLPPEHGRALLHRLETLHAACARLEESLRTPDS